MIREAVNRDFDGLMKLYTQLGENGIPVKTNEIAELWKKILNMDGYHIIVCEKDNKIVSSCVCVIIPNLTHNARPYAFVENVVTHREYRKMGLGTSCLNYAKEIAVKNNCYKLMLMTGSKKISTLKFYEKAGYNSNDKTAFVQWL